MVCIEAVDKHAPIVPNMASRPGGGFFVVQDRSSSDKLSTNASVFARKSHQKMIAKVSPIFERIISREVVSRSLCHASAISTTLCLASSFPNSAGFMASSTTGGLERQPSTLCSLDLRKIFDLLLNIELNHKYSFRNRPVCDSLHSAISSGVP